MAVTSSELERDMGRRTDALIKLSGSSRRALAAHLGTSLNNFSHKLGNVRGRSVNTWDALGIAEYFGVSVGVIYGTEPIPLHLELPRLDSNQEPAG